MGCGCNKPKPSSSKPKSEFTLDNGTGKVQTFGSRLEAQAANVRELNGSGIVRP